MRTLTVAMIVALGLALAGSAAAQTAGRRSPSANVASSIAELKDKTGPYPSVIYQPPEPPPSRANAPSNINCVPSLAPPTGSLSPQAAPNQPCR